MFHAASVMSLNKMFHYAILSEFQMFPCCVSKNMPCQLWGSTDGGGGHSVRVMHVIGTRVYKYISDQADDLSFMFLSNSCLTIS